MEEFMKRLMVIALLLLLCGASAWTVNDDEQCTALVAASAATVDGVSLLWKNRDADALSNKVVFVEEQPYSYLALVNADPGNGRLAWAAVNTAGFAISNTVTTNLPPPAGLLSASTAPSAGASSARPASAGGDPSIIMADAARTCATVEDFERFLTRNLGRDVGARTNFLTIDAHGGASIFEIHIDGFKRFNAADTAEKYLGLTNFSRSGTTDEGFGYLRFDSETLLLKGAPGGRLSVEYVLQVMARDIGHPLLHNPGRAAWRNLPADTPVWLHTNHTINNSSTASAIVIRSVKPGEDPKGTTMWVMLGEPLTSIAVPLWVAAGAPPPELWEGKDSALSKESARLKNVLRPLKTAERRDYVDVTRLDNAAGTGWLATTLAAERENLQQVEELLKRNPSASELAAFEKTAASRTLAVLQKIAVATAGAKTGNSQ
jgi:hypothetical protein